MFNIAELRDDRDGFAKSFLIVSDDACPALELVNGQSAERFARTARWKLVAGSSQEITRIRRLIGRITTGLHELTAFSMETFAAEPEYSPDGRWIAFQQFPNGARLSAIFVMRADGTDMRQVTPISMDAAHPEWSPDGSRIIFNNDFTQNVGDIFTIRPDGTGVKQLTHVIPLGQADFRPDYSPSGREIVFDQFIPGQPLQVLVMKANASRAEVINNSNAFAPDWGPRPLDESP